MKMATVTSSNEDIFSIAGQHTTASRFKLKSNTDDEIYSSRVNHSVAYTQLKKAITDGNLSFVKQLLDLGLDINYIYDTDQNYSFLHLACLMGHSKIIRYLLDCGANPNVKNASGLLPVDLIEADDLNTLSYMLLIMGSNRKNIEKPNWSEEKNV